MSDERCCANCSRWERSALEWEHRGWHRGLYCRVVEDAKEEEAGRESRAREYEEIHGEKLEPEVQSMNQASCLGLGWGNWGACNQDFGRGKALLCWDERRGYHAPLCRYLLTAHDHYCREWELLVDLNKMPKVAPSEDGSQESFQCPACGVVMTLLLHVHLPTKQEYWKGQCDSCGTRWVRQGADIEV